MLNKYIQVLAECKELANGIAGDQWNLGLVKVVSMEQFRSWAKVDDINGVVYLFTGTERCAYFEKESWFNLGNIMSRKHMSTFQYHVKYIHNDIFKPFRVHILQYAERVRKMHDLAKYW